MAAMKLTAVWFAVLLGSAAVCSGLTLARSSDSDSYETQKQSAITKVVKLLQNMLEKSKEDAEKMRFAFAKHKCHCEHTDADLVKAIDDNTKSAELLESQIQGLYGNTGELSQQVSKLHADMLANEEAQNEAIQNRERENKEFIATRQDLQSSVAQMDYAMKTLAEVGADQTMAAASYSKEFMRGHGASATSLIKMTEKVKQAFDLGSSFLSDDEQADMTSFLQAPFSGDYKAQSGQVVGALKNMKKTFKAQLEQATTDEFKAKKMYEAFMASKREAYNAMHKAYTKKQQELSGNDRDMATKKEQLASAKENKATAEDSLGTLREICTQKEKEYEQRKVLRGNEETAISEAVSILNSEHAFETFGKVDSTNANGATNFLQTQALSTHVAETRKKVIRILEQANTIKSPKLSKVLALVQREKNPFVEVITEISKMVKMADDEAQQDVEQKEWCKEERDEAKSQIESNEHDITALKAGIEQLTETLDAEFTGIHARIKSLGEYLSENGRVEREDKKERDEDYFAFKEDEKNLIAAGELLGKAIKVLSKYYDNFVPSGSSLIQTAKVGLTVEKKQVPTSDDIRSGTPETWDGAYSGQSEAANPAINMLKFIERNTKLELEQARKDEKEAEEQFQEESAKRSDDADEMRDELANLQDALAEVKKDRSGKKSDLKHTESEKQKTEKYVQEIKPGCDFINEHFETRIEQRKAEKDALLHAQQAIKGTPYYSAFDPETGAARGHRNAYNKQIGQYIGETPEACAAFKDVFSCEKQEHCIWDSTGEVCQEPASSS